MKTISLNQDWLLHEAPLNYGPTDLQKVQQYQSQWMECELPSDIRLPLIKYGKMKDPTLSDYCLEGEWVEKKSWWYKKNFTLTSQDLESDIIELKIDRIDTKRDIFMHGAYVRSHNDVHYPYIYNVIDYLHPGENELFVRVSTGLEDVTDDDMSEINWAVCTEYDNGGKYRGDKRRSFIRRPQYTVGWDWNPRVVTCGIGSAELNCYSQIAIREVSMYAESIEESALINVTVNVENLDIIGTKECDLYIQMFFEGEVVLQEKISD